jgi:D-serine deaminase-like pyridoxal phosphate-dependent protein
MHTPKAAFQGRPAAALETPCLLLDEQRMMRNIDRLTNRLRGLGTHLRPHLKTAKCLEVARRVMPTHAGPATVSTLKEAEQFGMAGVRDILYSVGISPSKLDRVVKLRRAGVNLSIVLDSIDQATAVAAMSRESGGAIPCLIEIDSDGHRAGVTPGDPRLLDVARTLVGGGAELRGVMTHAGASYESRGRESVEQVAERERSAAIQCAAAIRAAGMPCPVVSIGSTPTAHFGKDFSGVTEVRAGVFVFFDLVMAGGEVCELDDIAISVLATVIGHQRERGWTIIDAGWTALSRDHGTARQAVDQGYGVVCDVGGHPYEDLIVKQLSQEHGIIASRSGSLECHPDLTLGSTVRILPNHACATASQHAQYFLLGRKQEVVDVWPRFGGW